MEKQLSRALETRHSVSGTHFKNARVVRGVARAGLITGGSSDDTLDDLRLKPFLHPLSWPLFLFFSLILWILALRSDILFSYLSHLCSGPCNLQSHAVLPSSPKPVHTSHLYPAIPLSRHIHIISTTPRTVDSLLHSHFFSSCCNSLISSVVPSRFVLHSLFPVCSGRFALILFVFCFPCSRIVSPSSLLLLWSLVQSVLSLYLSISSSRHYLPFGIAISGIYRHSPCYRAQNAAPL
jgi:hypothetical protein